MCRLSSPFLGSRAFQFSFSPPFKEILRIRSSTCASIGTPGLGFPEFNPTLTASMTRFSVSATSLLFVVAIFFLSLPPAARSDVTGGAAVIQQVTTSKQTTDACGGVLAPPSCPINCFRADPVCGVDGVTYWCGCHDAICSGTGVAKLGACEVGNGGSASLPGQALLLVHTVWLFLLGFSLLFGLF